MGALPRKPTYSEELAQKVREVLGPRPDLVEKKMFGGLAFMLGGNMCCGIVKDDLMVRVGAEQFEDALAEPGARPMDFTGRPMRGMVYVDESGHGDMHTLAAWVARGARYAESLPKK